MHGVGERMAIRIDRPRLRSIFGRLGMPRDESEEFVDALEDTIDNSLQGTATNEQVHHMIAAAVNELKADAAEREARLVQHLVVVVEVVLTGIALATGIIIAVVTLT